MLFVDDYTSSRLVVCTERHIDLRLVEIRTSGGVVFACRCVVLFFVIAKSRVATPNEDPCGTLDEVHFGTPVQQTKSDTSALHTSSVFSFVAGVCVCVCVSSHV